MSLPESLTSMTPKDRENKQKKRKNNHKNI